MARDTADPPKWAFGFLPMSPRGGESTRDAEGMTLRERQISTALFWFTSSVLTTLVGTIVLVAFIIPASQNERTLNCETSECLAAYRYLHEQLDSNVHPCDDFYGHVCRKWSKIREGVGFLSDSLDRFLVKIKRGAQY
ncbi:uncharacterized protein LOC121837812 [Ixodes scapularis]|uniref:uncharacterized protein LOC121837812 n=1 Tax=Ixodes scapularis TaxID=6945 RepID=UPI001C3915F2|nr:uncharacterized protein LOC121837812 [Ixodes scapularis]